LAGKDTTDDVLVQSQAEGQGDLLGNARAAPAGIAALYLDKRRNQFRCPLPVTGEDQQLVLEEQGFCTHLPRATRSCITRWVWAAG